MSHKAQNLSYWINCRCLRDYNNVLFVGLNGPKVLPTGHRPIEQVGTQGTNAEFPITQSAICQYYWAESGMLETVKKSKAITESH